MPAPTASTRNKRQNKKPSGEKGVRRTRRKTPAGALDACQITNYTTAIRWLNAHADHERMRFVKYDETTFSLDRMARLLAAIGSPHEQVRCVQVVGTKGKGSTCAMLSSMLGACGYGVGLYTSPHLVDLRERITIGGQMITHADMAEQLRLIAEQVEGMGEDKPTYFEILTACALAYFADQAVDVAIMEAGLGGRLDATSAVTPLVTGITQISYDHVNILGPKLTDIAREKACAMKAQVPAISIQQEPEVEAVLREVAQERGAKLVFTGDGVDFSYRFEANRELGPHTRVSVTTETSRFEHLAVPLRGEHQAHNCGLALAMLDQLKAHGFTLPEDKVVAGLASTELPGRMEQVWQGPRVIVDGAHNAASIQALIRALGAHISYDSLVMVFGCGQDKDIRGMLQQIALGADKVLFTSAKSNPRAADPEELMARFNELSGKMSQTAGSLEEALRLAARAVTRDDLIVITGSFFLVGEAKKYFIDLKNKRAKA